MGDTPTLDYAQIYNTAAQTVEPGAAVTFDSAGTSNGVDFTAGGTEATVSEAGTYLVFPSVSPDAAGQFSVYLNGAPVAGGVLPTGGTASSGPVIVTAAAGDRISVVNTGSAASTLAAGTAPNASLYIQSLDTAAG